MGTVREPFRLGVTLAPITVPGMYRERVSETVKGGKTSMREVRVIWSSGPT